MAPSAPVTHLRRPRLLRFRFSSTQWFIHPAPPSMSSGRGFRRLKEAGLPKEAKPPSRATGSLPFRGPRLTHADTVYRDRPDEGNPSLLRVLRRPLKRSVAGCSLGRLQAASARPSRRSLSNTSYGVSVTDWISGPNGPKSALESTVGVLPRCCSGTRHDYEEAMPPAAGGACSIIPLCPGRQAEPAPPLREHLFSLGVAADHGRPRPPEFSLVPAKGPPTLSLGVIGGPAG